MYYTIEHLGRMNRGGWKRAGTTFQVPCVLCMVDCLCNVYVWLLVYAFPTCSFPLFPFSWAPSRRPWCRTRAAAASRASCPANKLYYNILYYKIICYTRLSYPILYCTCALLRCAALLVVRFPLVVRLSTSRWLCYILSCSPPHRLLHSHQSSYWCRHCRYELPRTTLVYPTSWRSAYYLRTGGFHLHRCAIDNVSY